MRHALLMVVLSALAPAATPADLPPLRAEGREIVDPTGKPVVLAGVNLGGLLVEEMWMMPFVTEPPKGSNLPPVKDHVSLWKTITDRLGEKDAARARDAFRDAWITDADFARMAAVGMNCVRLPFTYDLFEEPNGWERLDRTIDMASKHGIYTILDMHGAPGRQSRDHHTGETGVDRLFKSPENVEKTAGLWARIANRYRDRAEVAGYDLLNEPMGAPDVATLYLVQDRLLRSIRAVDPKHIVIVEDGYKTLDSFPRPAIVGWSNVVLSTHHYKFNAKSAEDQVKSADGQLDWVARAQKDRPVPYYVGEFQQEPHGTPETLGRFLGALTRAGHHWSIWTYKTAMKGGDDGMWGWIRARKPLDPIDPFRDSADAMIGKMDQLRSERLFEDPAMTRAFKAAAPENKAHLKKSRGLE